MAYQPQPQSAYPAQPSNGLAVASMVWSWLDLGVACVAGYQFWRLKSGAIVAVSKRLVSN